MAVLRTAQKLIQLFVKHRQFCLNATGDVQNVHSIQLPVEVVGGVAQCPQPPFSE